MESAQTAFEAKLPGFQACACEHVWVHCTQVRVSETLDPAELSHYLKEFPHSSSAWKRESLSRSPLTQQNATACTGM